jgi:beta-aspartyl-peptidase (threonine type)
MRIAQARMTMELLHNRWNAEAAVQRSLEILEERVQGEGGCILIDRNGAIGWGHNTPHMPCAYHKSGMEEPKVYIRKQDERTEGRYEHGTA